MKLLVTLKRPLVALKSKAAKARGIGLWLRAHYWWMMLCGGVALGGIAGAWYLVEIARAVRLMVDQLGLLTDGVTADPADLRNIATGIAVLLGALAAAATLIFQLVRVWITERTTQTAEQNLITGQINTAVVGLGAEKTVKRRERRVTFTVDGDPHEIWTEHLSEWPSTLPEGADDVEAHETESFDVTLPNIEVRVGAIYALERISQDSLRDHVQIMEILTAYLRENSSASSAQDHAIPPLDNRPETLNATERAARTQRLDQRGLDIRNWASGLRARTDIQTAMQVLARRSSRKRAAEAADKRYGDSGYRLDLRNTNLQAIDVSGLDLSHAQMARSRLEGANLREAKMQGANFSNAQIEGANLREADMRGADLRDAKMDVASLFRAQMESADLRGAQMESADLRRAQMNGTDLRGAQMDGADLRGAQMDGAAQLGARFDGKTDFDVDDGR